MEEEKTYCYSYFSICSKAELINGIGYVSDPKDGFDPAYITEKMGIRPFRSCKLGDLRPRGGARYGFSKWSACRQEEPADDVGEQCLKIVRELREKIPVLLELKQEYDLKFDIIIVPHIYREESPVMHFDKEVIEFCYLTGTEIDVDMYIYAFEEESDI